MEGPLSQVVEVVAEEEAVPSPEEDWTEVAEVGEEMEMEMEVEEEAAASERVGEEKVGEVATLVLEG